MINRTTISDVASHASVSTATVSRVLSGDEKVRERLKIRVLNAVAELQYTPSRIGRNLRKQQTDIIGLIVTDIQNPFHTSIVRAIQDVFHDKDYEIFIANSDENPDEEKIHITSFCSHLVAGLIFVPTLSDYSQFTSLFSGMPVVAIDRKPENLDIDSVVVDNLSGTLRATRYLLEHGHHRIGLIAGHTHLSTGSERLKGFLTAFRNISEVVDPDLIQYGNFYQQGGYDAMMRILNLNNPPTAVISSNNMMTLGALQAIHERCLSIPNDIAIIGFDDMNWATSLQPPLTVIAQPTQEIGRQAANLLLDRLAHPDLPSRHVVLDTELIIRSSVKNHSCI